MKHYSLYEIEQPIEFGSWLIIGAALVPIASTVRPEKGGDKVRIAVPSVEFTCKDKNTDKPVGSLNVCTRQGGVTLAMVRKDSSGKEYLHTLASYGFDPQLGMPAFKPGFGDDRKPYNISLDKVGPLFELAGVILDDENSAEFRQWLMTPEGLAMGEENRATNAGLSKILGVSADHFANVRRAVLAGGGADAYRQAALDRANGIDSTVTSLDNVFNEF